MLDQIKRLVKARENFVIETTLSGLGYARHISQWRSSGYHMSLIFLSLRSLNIALERVRNRVKQGGHNIPPDVIKRRFIAGLENFNTIYRTARKASAFRPGMNSADSSAVLAVCILNSRIYCL